MTSPTAPFVGVFTIDAPDASALAAFYGELLGLDTLAEGDGYAMIGKEGTTTIGFSAVEGFEAPPWPDAGRKQFHLDVAASDIEATVAQALELGATKPDHQPGETWTVLLDPAGHPFCVTDASFFS
jgi:predicted enzyme related to lactoylglutathione lyase